MCESLSVGKTEQTGQGVEKSEGNRISITRGEMKILISKSKEGR